MSDERLGQRSPQVRWVPFGDGLLLHDERRHEVHLLNATGALVWQACDGTTTVAEAADAFAEALGHPVSEVAAGIRTHLAQLRVAELLDQPAPAASVASAPEVIDEPVRSPLLRVLDRDVAVAADDVRLLDELLEPFEDLVVVGAPTVEPILGVARVDGGVRLHGWGHDQVFARPSDAIETLASLLNRIAAAATAMVAFHAGAVRAPDGRVVVVAGPSGAGKSTLTAALVRSGWDYLTDEAVGIASGTLQATGYPKPLALDPHSRALLGLPPIGPVMAPVRALRAGARGLRGAAGPVAAVIALRAPDEARSGDAPGAGMTALSPADALVHLAPQALNLTASGPDGLATLAELVQRVPVVELGERDLAIACALVREQASRGA